MKVNMAPFLARRFVFWFGVVTAVFSAHAQTVQTNLTVTTLQSPSLNGGTIQGSLQELTGASFNVNSGFVLTGDLLVPGTPALTLNGNPSFSGTIVGTGSASPTGYQVTLNSGCSLRYLRTRTTPISLATVAAPPSPTGTRSVNINSAGQSYGAASTLDNLTLNGNVGMYSVPPGTYGTFSVDGGSGLILGVTGAVQAVSYNLQNLNLNSGSSLQIVGPVVLTVANGFSANGVLGTANNPAWLQLQVASGGLTLNSGCTIYGSVLAPNGTVSVNGSSTLVGVSASEQFTLNSGGLVRWSGASTQTNQVYYLPTAFAQSLTNLENTALPVTLTGSDPQGYALTYSVLTSPAHGTLTGTTPSLTYQPAANYYGNDSFTFRVNDGLSNSATATISITNKAVDYPPVVAPGTNQSLIWPGNLVNLAGTVSYANFPGTVDTVLWSKVSGPGSVTFGSASSAVTTATFSTNGTYQLQLFASDSYLSASNSLRVTVDQAPGVSAGLNQTNLFPGAITLRGSVTDDGLPTGGALTTTWSLVSGAGTVAFSTAMTSNALAGVAISNGVVTTATFSTNGAYVLQLTASDGLATNHANVTVTEDRVPVANSQTVTLPENSATNITLTGSDPQGLTLSYTVLTQPSHGSLSGTPPSLTYTPAANFYGNDNFTFRVNNGLTNSATATISLVVSQVYFPPVAYAQNLTNVENTGLPITLTGSDPEGYALAYSVVTQPAHGTLTGTTPNLTYLPATNYYGNDAFTFRVNDGVSNSAPATISITNRAVDYPPVVAAGASQSIIWPSNLVNLAGTVSYANFPGTVDTVLWSKVSGPGSVTFRNASSAVTTATFSTNGVYQLQFFASDSYLSSSNILRVTVDQAPVVNAGLNQTNLFPGAITLRGSVTDDGLPTGGALTTTWSLVSGPGTVVFSTAVTSNVLAGVVISNAIATTATFSTNGVYVLQLTASDGLATNHATVTVTEDRVPVANSQTVTLPENSSTNITLTGSDPQGLTLAYTVLTEPTHGALTGTPPSLTYNPVANFYGNDSITFQVNNGLTNSATATISLVVSPVDYPPVVVAGTNQTILWPSNLVNLAGTVSYANYPGTVGTVLWSKLSGPGTVTFGNANATSTTATFSASGLYILQLQASDGISSSTSTGTITVDAAPTVVIATPPLVIWPSNQVALSSVVTDDGLPVGGILTATWSLISGPGTVAFAPQTETNGLTGSAITNQLVTTAAFSAPGQYVVSLTADDGVIPNSSDATIFVDQAPTAASQTLATIANTSLNLTLTGNDFDNNALTYQTVAAPANGSLSGTPPNLIYQPNTGFSGTDSFTFVVNDGYVDSAPATVSITVSASGATPPVAQSQSLSAIENTLLNITLTATDATSNSLTFQVLSQPANGTLNGNAPNLVYQPNTGFTGSDSFTFVANDGQNNSAPATVFLTINAVNQPPQLTVPGAQTVNAGNFLTFDTNRLISVTDPDGGTNLEELSLSVTNGWLSFSTTSGLTWLTDSRNQNNVEVLGTLASLNTALNGMTYLPAVGNVCSEDTLSLSIDDLGNTGYSGDLTAAATIPISITAATSVNPAAATTGTDFWVGRLACLWNFRIRWAMLLSENDATVTQTGSDGSVTTLSLSAGVPYASALESFSPFQQSLPSDTITNTAFHLTSTQPISVYAFDETINNMFAYRVLPTPVLGTNYVIVAYQNPAVLPQNYYDGPYLMENVYGSQFSVTAAQDQTVVTIIPTVTTSGHPAGQPYTVTLQTGQTYNLRHRETPYGDLTGTIVTANNPVAVLGGDAGAQIPSTSGIGHDLGQQMSPVELWDNEYVALKLVGCTNQIVRIVSGYDATGISIPGIGATNLNRGQFWELWTTNDLHIVATQPVAVCQFSPSLAAPAYDGNTGMTWVPGVHQGLTSSQLRTPEANHTLTFGGVRSLALVYSNYVNLVVASSSLSCLTVNGVPLTTNAVIRPVGEGDYTGVSMVIDNINSWTATPVVSIQCSTPVVCLSYGWACGPAGWGPDAYGLPAPFAAPVFPPNVQLTISSPSTGSLMLLDAPITVTALLTDPQKAVLNTVLEVDGVTVDQEVTTNFSWTPTTVGHHLLRLVAMTSGGLTVSSPSVSVTVVTDFTTEGVQITAPDDGDFSYVGVPTTIALGFNDPLGNFAYAEFFANNVSLGQTTNITFNWLPAATNDYVLSATIYDDFGNAYDSTNTVTVHVVPVPVPSVMIACPANDSTVPVGVSSLVMANVNDPGQLTTNVQIYVDGVNVSNTNFFTWTPTQLGSHTLQAAAQMTSGGSISSAIITVTVAKLSPPMVSLLSPTNNQCFASGTVPVVSAQAADSDSSISNLALTLDSVLLGQASAATLTVPASNITAGWHRIVAQATDNIGMSASSPVVSFFVDRGENNTLPAPGPLSAAALSGTQILLSWQPVTTNALTQGISIERWDPVNLLWTEIAELSVTSTNYIDTSLAPETFYRYQIACVDTNGNSSVYSAEADATTRTLVPNYAVMDISASVASLATNLVPGGNILTNSGLPNFDLRRTIPLGIIHSQSVLGTNATTVSQAVASFAEQWPQIQLDYNPASLSPHSIMPRAGYLTGPGGSGVTVSSAYANLFDSGDPYRPVEAFLAEYQALFGFGPEEITNALVQRDYVTPADGLHTVVWQQQVVGVPVFNALFSAHMTATGELACISCDFTPTPALAVDPEDLAAVLNGYDLPFSGADALQTAVNNVGDVFDETDISNWSGIQGITRNQTFTAANGIKGNAYAVLTWFPTARNELDLAWQIIFTSQWRDDMFLTVVSADNNQILYRRDLTDDSSAATYNVYTNASPAPMLPGLSAPGPFQAPLVNRTLMTLIALDTNASPNGWINDGDNQTLGNNVDAHLDPYDYDISFLYPPRPTGNPARVFDFGLDLGSDPSTYSDASVVQVFYWDNWMHDVLYDLGFTEAAGNFQTDNFGRGGLDGDAVQAAAQDGLSLNDGQHYNNANMSTPVDGYPPLMRMYVFNGSPPSRDGSLDAEVVLHEYTHGLSTRLIGGGAGIDAEQTAGMGEGWSDFFALSLLADPTSDPDAPYPTGSYVVYDGFGTTFNENYYYGIRHYPYCTDTNVDPLTYEDIDPSQESIHAGVPCSPLMGPLNPVLAGEVHNQGEVWCTMLWEMRSNLIHKYGGEAGNNLSLQLVTDGLRLSPPNPTFVQARDAILLADQMLANGADTPEIWAAFSKRGLGYSAMAPNSYTTTGVQESYTPAPALVVAQVIVQGDANGFVVTNQNNNLSVVLQNQSTGTVTQVSVQITTTTPGVQILQSQSSYADIPQNQSGANTIPLQITTLPGFVPGTAINVSAVITSAQQTLTTSLSLYSGNPGTTLPPGGDPSYDVATSGSVTTPDLTPWDLGNLEPLWMADNAVCLLKAAPGKYVLWQPNAAPIPLVNSNFVAHRLTRQGVLVGTLSLPSDPVTSCVMQTNCLGQLVPVTWTTLLPRSVGAQWIPGQAAPTPLTPELYTYPKGAALGYDVGVAFDLDPIPCGSTYLAGVTNLPGSTNYPTIHSVWAMNSAGQSAGAVSVYMLPPDGYHAGYISTNDVLLAPQEIHFFDGNGQLDWFQADERTLSASNSGNATIQLQENVLLTSAACFNPANLNPSWTWLGPVSSGGSSLFSVGLLINDQGEVGGTGAFTTGNAQDDAYNPTRVFRWNVNDGEYALAPGGENNLVMGPPIVETLGLLSGEHAFPMAMNQGGDIVGYSDLDVFNPSLLHAVFWSATNTAAHDLGTLGVGQVNSQAFAVDDYQQIVGTAMRDDGSTAAVLWQLNQNSNSVPTMTNAPYWEITDLNSQIADTNWYVFNAVDINTNGLILADATNAAGQLHAVLLIPAKIEAFTRDPDSGEYSNLGGEAVQSDAVPETRLLINNASFDGNDLVADITCQVRDPLSEIRDVPPLQELEFLADGEVMQTIPNLSSLAQGELAEVWQVRPSEVTLNTAIRIPNAGAGIHTIQAQTGLNADGNYGFAASSVVVIRDANTGILSIANIDNPKTDQRGCVQPFVVRLTVPNIFRDYWLQPGGAAKITLNGTPVSWIEFPGFIPDPELPVGSCQLYVAEGNVPRVFALSDSLEGTSPTPSGSISALQFQVCITNLQQGNNFLTFNPDVVLATAALQNQSAAGFGALPAPLNDPAYFESQTWNWFDVLYGDFGQRLKTAALSSAQVQILFNQSLWLSFDHWKLEYYQTDDYNAGKRPILLLDNNGLKNPVKAAQAIYTALYQMFFVNFLTAQAIVNMHPAQTIPAGMDPDDAAYFEEVASFRFVRLGDALGKAEFAGELALSLNEGANIALSLSQATTEWQEGKRVAPAITASMAVIPFAFKFAKLASKGVDIHMPNGDILTFAPEITDVAARGFDLLNRGNRVEAMRVLRPLIESDQITGQMIGDLWDYKWLATKERKAATRELERRITEVTGQTKPNNWVAHHDLNFATGGNDPSLMNLQLNFLKRGLDCNDAAIGGLAGRFVPADFSQKVLHYTTKAMPRSAWNFQWEHFFVDNPTATSQDIIAFMKQLQEVTSQAITKNWTDLNPYDIAWPYPIQ